MYRFAWNKNQMIADVTLWNFVITYVIQNMLHFRVILHGSYKIAHFLHMAMNDVLQHGISGVVSLTKCCYEFCQNLEYFRNNIFPQISMSQSMTDFLLHGNLFTNFYVYRSVCVCVCLCVCVSVAKFVFAISQVSV